jgi:hypothetical protein
MVYKNFKFKEGFESSTTPISGLNNAIINGGFDIWQRGTSSFDTGYCADRWIVLADGTGTRNISRANVIPSSPYNIPGYYPQYYLRYQQAVAGSGATFNILEQRIEGVGTFSEQYITVSFWARSNTYSTISYQIQQNFGTGGSSEVQAMSTQTISLTNGWKRYSYTTKLTSILDKTVGANSYLAFRINMPLNVQLTVDIWGVQLEKNTIATPFERRPLGIELALCQRYYHKLPSSSIIFGFQTNSSDTYRSNNIFLPQSMRIPLTTGMISVVWSGGTGQGVTVSTGSSTEFRTYTNMGNTTYSAFIDSYSVNAEL